MSSAAQLRKIKKPLIEKRRRERMNDCLNQLKTLVLEGRNTNSNESRYSKMEKVDILEMTVRYLQDHRHSLSAAASAGAGSPQSLTARYIEGYGECAAQVSQYLSSTKELSQDTCQRLSQYLLDSLRRTNPSTRQTSPLLQPQILTFGRPVDPRSPLQSADCASTMLKTSVQNPAILSTNFAVLETDAAGGLSPQTCSRVIIPFYLSSATPSILPITHSSGQIMASATFQPLTASSLFNPTSSSPSTPSLFASSVSPNLLKSLTTSQMNCDSYGNGVSCSSPRQGDECPSSTSVFTPEEVRSQTLNPSIPTPPSSTPSPFPATATFHDDRWRQQTLATEVVWRPWNGCTGKMS